MLMVVGPKNTQAGLRKWFEGRGSRRHFFHQAVGAVAEECEVIGTHPVEELAGFVGAVQLILGRIRF